MRDSNRLVFSLLRIRRKQVYECAATNHHTFGVGILYSENINRLCGAALILAEKVPWEMYGVKVYPSSIVFEKATDDGLMGH